MEQFKKGKVSFYNSSFGLKGLRVIPKSETYDSEASPLYDFTHFNLIG